MACHTAMLTSILTSVNLAIFKKEKSFNFQHVPLIFASFTKCDSLFQFIVFFVCYAYIIKFSIV